QSPEYRRLAGPWTACNDKAKVGHFFSTQVSSPNAGAHLLPKAAARDERRLEAVRCSAWLGSYLRTGTEQLQRMDKLLYVPGNFIFVERINDLSICERQTIAPLEMLTKCLENLLPRYDSHPCCEIVPTRREPSQGLSCDISQISSS